jgi:hypothetical protein
MRRNFLIGKAVRLRRKIRKIAYGIVPIKAAAERKLAPTEVCDASFDVHLLVGLGGAGTTLSDRSEDVLCLCL